jgi:hypothetical protein
MVTINVENKIKALQDTLDRLYTFYTNGLISSDEYYSREVLIKYELECLRDEF